MRVIFILITAVFALTIATAASADCGCKQQRESCGCSEKQDGCGCKQHKKCGGDVQLMPEPSQCNADMPQCCPQGQYTICCEQATFKLLCQPEPCKKPKCESGCGKCVKKKCVSCATKRKCGCGKCG